MQYPNFKSFIKTNWWFLLLGFGKALVNSEKLEMTGSSIFDFLIFIGILLLIMYIYWFIRYNKK